MQLWCRHESLIWLDLMSLSKLLTILRCELFLYAATAWVALRLSQVGRHKLFWLKSFSTATLFQRLKFQRASVWRGFHLDMSWMLIVSLGLLLSIVECLNSECDSYMTYLSVFDNISKWVMPSQKVVVFPVHHTHIEPLCQVQKSHAIYLIMRC